MASCDNVNNLAKLQGYKITEYDIKKIKEIHRKKEEEADNKPNYLLNSSDALFITPDKVFWQNVIEIENSSEKLDKLKEIVIDTLNSIKEYEVINSINGVPNYQSSKINVYNEILDNIETKKLYLKMKSELPSSSHNMRKNKI